MRVGALVEYFTDEVNGGEVVGAHYYRSIDCLSIAVRALEGINTPQSSEALELIRAIQTQSRA